MNDDDMQLLIDLHRFNERQGPGSAATTQQAIALAGLDASRRLNIADIGCGTGASTIELAKTLDAEIMAVDFVPNFLDTLQLNAQKHAVADQITTVNASMAALPFDEETFDVIWSEGAIYNMGFAAGVSDWRRLLKKGGKLVVSEITWLRAERPPEIQAYWDAAYPEIDTAAAKIKILEQQGYLFEAYFYLPEACWLEHYYQPLQRCFKAFLDRHAHSEQARNIVIAEEREIALYTQQRNVYSYGMYIAQKI